MNVFRKALIAFTTFLGLLLAGGASPALAAPATAPASVGGNLVYTLDMYTGDVLSVQRATPTVSPSAITNSCATANTCWRPSSLPYQQYGFTSKQAYSGTWANRGTLTTGNHSVNNVCWQPPTASPVVCSSLTYGPSVSVSFTGTVTGKSVTLLN